MPVSGGESRELFRLQEGKRFYSRVGLSWTPDGRHVVVGTKLDELSMIPATGGELRKLDLGFRGMTRLSLHPDGRQIAYSLGNSTAEVWVMENFLPVVK